MRVGSGHGSATLPAPPKRVGNRSHDVTNPTHFGITLEAGWESALARHESNPLRHGSYDRPVTAIDPDHLPEGEEKAAAVRSMFDAIAPRYDLVNRIMTFRMDVGWRKRTVRDLHLRAGSTVIDLAAGTGDLCRELDAHGLRPIGFDLSYGMLAAARTDAPLVQADALRLPLADGAVDGATCGFALRNFVDLGQFFDELGRVVRPGGRIALLEVAEPPNAFLRWGHSRLLRQGRAPDRGRAVSDGNAYRYLPKSVAYLPEPDAMLDRLGQAGFFEVDRALLSVGHRPADHRHPAMTGRPVPHRLTARTRRLDRDVDLLDVAGADGVLFERGRAGFAGRGVADRVPLDVVAGRARRRRRRRRGRPTRLRTGGVRRPSLRSRRAHRPRRAGAGRRPGRGRHPLGHDASPRATHPIPSRRSTASRPVSRRVPVRRRSPSSPPARRPPGWPPSPRPPAASRPATSTRSCWLARWSSPPTSRSSCRPSSPGCASSTRGASCTRSTASCGASPELLVSRAGDLVRSQPMAGTAPRRGDPQADAQLAAALLASPGLPPRARGDDRLRPRHPARLLLVPRRRARAVRRPAGQRPAPRHRRSRDASPTRRRRCSSWSVRCTRPRRCAAGPARRPRT